MHEVAHGGDVVFVDAVGGRVGDHDRGDVLAVGVEFGAQIVEVDVAAVAGAHHDDLQAGQDRGGGVGAVRRLRDQADAAAGVAARVVIGADGQQARQFSLRSGVGLQ